MKAAIEIVNINMHRQIGTSAWIAIISLVVISGTHSFTPSPNTKQSLDVRGTCQGLIMSSLDDNNNNNSEGQQSPAQKQQQKRMEKSSIAGAEAIRKIDIEERTKRAMLAEAVEDRIFDLADDLDLLVKRNGGVENLSEDVREEAVELAKQTKALQVQYDDLVNGGPSQLLEMGGNIVSPSGWDGPSD